MGRFSEAGRVAAAPGVLPSVGYNLTALSQDTCRAKTRHPTKAGADGDVLVSAKPPVGLEQRQEPLTHKHTPECMVKSHTCVVKMVVKRQRARGCSLNVACV